LGAKGQGQAREGCLPVHQDSARPAGAKGTSLFGPCRPRQSRNTSSMVRWVSASTSYSSPFTVSCNALFMPITPWPARTPGC
jgi:hypothetical protein